MDYCHHRDPKISLLLFFFLLNGGSRSEFGNLPVHGCHTGPGVWNIA